MILRGWAHEEGATSEITRHRLSRLRKNYKWGQPNFDSPYVWDRRETSRRMLKKAGLLRPRVVRARGSSQSPRPFFSILLEIESYLSIRVAKMLADPDLLVMLAQ
jgi:hypothetical protein